MIGNQPIVLDNGTGLIKIGFAGNDKPKNIFRNFIGKTKNVRVMPGGALEGSDIFIGMKAEEHRGSLLLSYPMKHGIIDHWSDMEKIWTYIYSKDILNVPSDEHNILITEPPLNPFKSRDKTAEFFFEGLNVPGLYFAIQAILSLYASGRTTGIVLDSGDGVTHCVPVYEGFASNHTITRVDIAGRDITNQLKLLLRRSGHVFTTSAELEIIRQMKENCCNIIHNPNDTDIKASAQYQLPDGSIIDIGHEVYRAPEILFQPHLIGSECQGVHDSLITSIMKSDIDLRKTLFSQIVLAGGSTLFPGFGDRLLTELRKHLHAPKNTKIRIAAPTDRLYTTWIGGSILASLSTFKTMWISKAEYQEHGSRILHTREF